MKRLALALLMLITLLVLAAAPQFAQQGAPQLPLKPVPDFFKLPPNMNFGEPSAVTTDSRRHVFVLAGTSPELVLFLRRVPCRRSLVGTRVSVGPR